MIRSRHTSIAVTALAAIALAIAACGPTSGPLGTPATPAPSTEPSLDLPSDDVTPGTPVPSSAPSGTPVASTTPAGTPTPTATATGETMIVRAYFIQGSIPDVPGAALEGLVPVLRVVPKSTAVARAAMTALLDGPNSVEAAYQPGLFTTIPDGTHLLGISIAGGVATVNLSAEFESGGGSASIFGRLAQVVYTLTQFPTVKTVLFQLDGIPVEIFSGEGVILDHEVGRADYQDQARAIFVDRPAWGASIGNPAIVSGKANVFEAQFLVRLLDKSGALIAEQAVTASCGTGCWGTFKVTVPYTVSAAQYGTLRVLDLSEMDGSEIEVVDYPVWLTPPS